ncbi:hypothetical protein DMB65_21520 [Flavobacterium cheongpyeongense]|uniref:Uncharacterized protein n=1 Tax=Flavobacterium cheongpyeongense TaxID=2212651 RepID=A0A2V4BJH2_9FLAO|nr:hypothetical protein DMB65_21520 [Flavobacterium cheongpyeongense]
MKRLKQRGYQSLTDVYIELNSSLCEPPSTACPDFYRDDPYARWCSQVFIVFFGFREYKYLRGALRQLLAEPSTRLCDRIFI